MLTLQFLGLSMLGAGIAIIMLTMARVAAL